MWQVPLRSLAALGLVVAIGCNSDRTLGEAESSASSESSGGPPASSTSGEPLPGATSSGVADDDTRGSEPTGAGFAGSPDFGDGLACDVFLQNCPAGLKCTMDYFDASHPFCTPVVDDPRHEGESCHVEGTHHSGIDDCEIGALCWGATDETLMGTCLAFCGGGDGEVEYLCEDPSTACAVSGGIELSLCVPSCEPLRPTCGEGEACVPVNDLWSCAPDASGDAGTYGDACEFVNACDPGLVCLDATTQPPGLPCELAAGCCTEVCDLHDPAGAQQCSGAADGVQCVPYPWYHDDTAPPGYEPVGVCMLPQ